MIQTGSPEYDDLILAAEDRKLFRLFFFFTSWIFLLTLLSLLAIRLYFSLEEQVYMVTVPMMLLLWRPFSRYIFWVYSSLEQREMPFFRETDLSLLLERIFLLLPIVLDSLKAEYLLWFDCEASVSLGWQVVLFEEPCLLLLLLLLIRFRFISSLVFVKLSSLLFSSISL